MRRFLLAGLLVACTPAPIAVGPTGARLAAQGLGEVVVRFENARAFQAVRGARLTIPALNAAVLPSVQGLEGVRYAEPIRQVQALAQDDEQLPRQWGMAKIGATRAWAVTKGRPEVLVAVVDTGVDYTHPDLAGHVVRGHDHVNNDDDPMDDHRHGTHCAGTIVAQHGNGGLAGLAPGVTVIAIKVLSRTAGGESANVAAGIVEAADRGARVLSLSLGGTTSSLIIADAVRYAQAKGALVVAAMGNDNSTIPMWPAAQEGVLAVAATTDEDQKAYFSNLGPHVSVAAPGAYVLSTVPGGKFKELSGTSMAAPHVSALAALLLSRSPGMTAGQVRERIEQTAKDIGEPGFDHAFGHGRIDAGAALAL
jgi:thermitase